MVQIFNVLLAVAIFTTAIAAPVHETRGYTNSASGIERRSGSVSEPFSILYERGRTPKKPTVISKIIKGVEKYAKQCQFIRDEDSGTVFVRELSNNDLDARGTFLQKIKGVMQKCHFIRDDETNEVYVRATDDLDELEMLGARDVKSFLGKAIKSAKGWAQQCHFMRDFDEGELLVRDPSFGAVLKKVKGLAHRCHLMG